MGKLLLISGLFMVFLSSAQTSEDRTFTKQLCSPEFHGRGYVNKGDSIAATFIANSFKKCGLKPLKGSYFQAFQHDVNTFPGKCEFGDTRRTFTPGIHYLIDPSSSGGEFTLIPTTFPIEVLLDNRLIQKKIIDLKTTKQFNSILINLTGYGSDTLKQLNTLAEHLANVLPVITVTDKKLTWSVSNQQVDYPLIQLQDSVYSADSHFNLKLDAQFERGYTSRNVIGFLKARKKTKQTLVISAHYDHLGRMGQATLFPGGNDNASGTAMLFSLANYFKEHKPDINILFIAFAAEEAGLIGSNYFVEHPLLPLNTIQFVLNLDIMGSGEEGITVVNATLHPEQFATLNRLNSNGNYLKTVKSRGPAANSDHYWFTQKNVPAFFIYTMGENKHYHDVFDTYDALSFSTFDALKQLLIQFSSSLVKQE